MCWTPHRTAQAHASHSIIESNNRIMKISQGSGRYLDTAEIWQRVEMARRPCGKLDSFQEFQNSEGARGVSGQLAAPQTSYLEWVGGDVTRE